MEANKRNVQGEDLPVDTFDVMGSLSVEIDEAEQILGDVVFNPQAVNRYGQRVPGQPLVFFDNVQSLRKTGQSLWGDRASAISDEELPARIHELREGMQARRIEHTRQLAKRNIFNLLGRRN